MNNKINILFVSIAFPPKSDPECLQTAKYFKYLAKDESLNIDVVTSPDNTLFMPIDENLRKYAQGYRKIIKVPFFENRYVNFLMRKIDTESLQYPDSKFRFAKKWKFVLKNIKNEPDIIYSRSAPISSAIMAYRLHKVINVPWILHLSDPWTLDPDHHYDKSKEWNENMEKLCFEAATILSFTSKKTIELYQKKYPQFASKMKFFPNVFDVDNNQNTSYEFGEKIKVVFTGGLVGNRSAKEFFVAIENLSQKHSKIISDFEFIFAGALDRKNRILFEKAISNVKHLGQLSYPDALKLQAEADILLLIDTPFNNEDDALFFPSKLLDYMIMRKRIIALTDKNGTSWNFIENKIGNCFTHEDTAGIENAIIKIWTKWKNKDIDYFYHNNVDMNFSASYNAKQLSNLFHTLHEGNTK